MEEKKTSEKKRGPGRSKAVLFDDAGIKVLASEFCRVGKLLEGVVEELQRQKFSGNILLDGDGIEAVKNGLIAAEKLSEEAIFKMKLQKIESRTEGLIARPKKTK